MQYSYSYHMQKRLTGGQEGAPAAVPSRGQANPRRGISEGSRWGWGPSAIEKKSGRKGGKNRKGRMGGRERPRPCRGARLRQGYGGSAVARERHEASGGWRAP